MGNQNSADSLNPTSSGLIRKYKYFYLDITNYLFKSARGYKFIYNKRFDNKPVLFALDNTETGQSLFRFFDFYKNIDCSKLLLLENKHHPQESPAHDLMDILADLGRSPSDKGVLILNTYFINDIIWQFYNVGFRGLIILINPNFNIQRLRDVIDSQTMTINLGDGNVITDHDLDLMKEAKIHIYFSAENVSIYKFKDFFRGNFKMEQFTSDSDLLKNIQQDVMNYYR